MSSITLEMIEKTYILANKIVQGKISNKTAVYYLESILDMNKNSAQKYLSCIIALLTGGHYRSTVNESAIDYYCNNILIDFGSEKLQIALEVLKDHLEYQNGKKSLPGMWRIYYNYISKIK